LAVGVAALLSGCSGEKASEQQAPILGMWEGVSKAGDRRVAANFKTNGHYTFEVFDRAAKDGVLYSFGGRWEVAGHPASGAAQVTLTPSRDFPAAAQKVEKKPHELKFSSFEAATPAPAPSDDEDEGGFAPQAWVIQTPWGEFLLRRPVDA
jgi:hypothetical protein